MGIDQPGQQASIRAKVGNFCPRRGLCPACVQATDLPVLDDNPRRAPRALPVEHLPGPKNQQVIRRPDPVRRGSSSWLAAPVIGLSHRLTIRQGVKHSSASGHGTGSRQR